MSAAAERMDSPGASTSGLVRPSKVGPKEENEATVSKGRLANNNSNMKHLLQSVQSECKPPNMRARLEHCAPPHWRRAGEGARVTRGTLPTRSETHALACAVLWRCRRHSDVTSVALTGGVSHSPPALRQRVGVTVARAAGGSGVAGRQPPRGECDRSVEAPPPPGCAPSPPPTPARGFRVGVRVRARVRVRVRVGVRVGVRIRVRALGVFVPAPAQVWGETSRDIGTNLTRCKSEHNGRDSPLTGVGIL
eukprot:3925556-Pyramimonas_sp.AAC.1